MFKDILHRLRETDWKKHFGRAQTLVHEKPILIGIIILSLVLLLNLVGIGSTEPNRILERPVQVSFQTGRILNDREAPFYRGKEKLLSQKASALADSQKQLQERLDALEKRLQEQQPQVSPQGNDANPTASSTPLQEQAIGAGNEVPRFHDPVVDLYSGPTNIQRGAIATSRGTLRIQARGPDLIAFPVKEQKPTEGVVLPSGSYVKAKMLTGVDVPEGKTYPVLMVLDYSYVAPNDTRLDLTGCFMIAKAEGDLSTERVQMQASKMSCVSKRGKMFEREVNGFIADNKDGMFAMSGKVNSKQGRVASMAFLSSVVEGVGRAIQQAQTTQSTNPFGGSQSVLTGDSEKYIAAGGAANAASMVAQWYLRQAQNLSPTVSVASGREVWIVMKDKVDLPEEFFKKERGPANGSIYSYFSRAHE